jgi:hypothetical protein
MKDFEPIKRQTCPSTVKKSVRWLKSCRIFEVKCNHELIIVGFKIFCLGTCSQSHASIWAWLFSTGSIFESRSRVSFPCGGLTV